MEQVEARVGPLWLPVRRSPLVQAGEVLMIDDFSAYGVNGALRICEKIIARGVDEIAGVGKALMEAVTDGSAVSVRLPGGRKLVGRLAAELADEREREIVGAEYDLAHAYKQWARSLADAAFSIIVRWSAARQRTVLHESFSLGFGAAAAINAFSPVARASMTILVDLFSVGVVNYFDNYPHVTVRADATHAKQIIVDVFKLLGWDLMNSGDASYSPTLTSLGVVFDCRRIQSHRYFQVANKAGRIEQVSQLLMEMLGEKRVWPSAVRSLAGLLRYARSKLSGRCGALALRLPAIEAD